MLLLNHQNNNSGTVTGQQRLERTLAQMQPNKPEKHRTCSLRP